MMRKTCLGRYIKKQKNRNKILGKEWASLDRYYLATFKNQYFVQKKKRSWKDCYKQSYRILKNSEQMEILSLKAMLNDSMKHQEVMGSVLAVVTILLGYAVDSYALGFQQWLNLKFDVQINNVNETAVKVFWGLIVFSALLFFVSRILSRLPRYAFFLSVIEDVLDEKSDG